MTWSVAVIIGPALSGRLIGNDLAHVWVVARSVARRSRLCIRLRLRRHPSHTPDGVEAEVVLAA